MATIIDQLDYLEETKSLIKEAIVNKGVSVSNDDTFRSYVDKINNIETGSSSEVIVDIFNHGDVQWLNPYFGNCPLNGRVKETYNYNLPNNSIYNGTYTTQQTFNNTRCIRTKDGNIQSALPRHLSVKGYKYLYVDVETQPSSSYTYTTLTFGCYKDYSFLQSIYSSGWLKTFPVLTWFQKGNHKVTKKDTFKRSVVQFDVSSFDKIIFGWHQCDQDTKIYSIWLSNEEEPHYDFPQDYES